MQQCICYYGELMSSKKVSEKGKWRSELKNKILRDKNLLIALAVSVGYLVLIIGLDAVLVSLIHKGDLKSIISWWKGVRVILLLWVFVVFCFVRTYKDKSDDREKKGVKENERGNDINENKKSGNKGANAVNEPVQLDVSDGEQSSSTETEAEEICEGQSEESDNS